MESMSIASADAKVFFMSHFEGLTSERQSLWNYQFITEKDVQ